MKKTILSFAALALAVSGLSACGEKKAEITIDNPVVRAIDAMSMKGEDGKYMSASFMTIKNSGNADVTLVGAESDVADEMQIHEVVNGQMQQKAGGLVIPAGKSVKLRMGGYHVMFLGLNKDLKVGDEVTVKLLFNDDSSITYTAPVKEVPMTDETYGAAVSGGSMDMK